MASSVLIIGNKAPLRAEIGAAMAGDFTEAKKLIENRSPSVVVFEASKAKEFQDFCAFLLKNSPDSRWLINGDSLSPSTIIDLTNHGHLFDLIDGFDDPELLRKIQAADESSALDAQQVTLAEMFADQTRHLARLKQELEARIERRHKTLRKSKKTLDATKNRLEAFHRALIGIHRARTILQMEQTLNEALETGMPGVTLRVRFAQQSSLAQNPQHHTLAIEIPFLDKNLRGEVLFSSDKKRHFTPDETDFLHELTEALALALSRLNKFEEAATLKTQWQATFDSIPHPLCLTTADHEILKLNLAYQQACSHLSFRELIGKNCFQMFFGPDFKPSMTSEGAIAFRAQRGMEHFEVSGEMLGLTHDNQPVRMTLLRPITEEVRYERRIFEISKLAELGTIGSSIAHELNNPLGGMLSFLQLILMELKPDDPMRTEIKSMEQATLRCRDIVQNLLSFARKQDLGDFVTIDLREVVDRSIRLIELQSKPKGIHIEWRSGPEARVSGSANALSQALCNILQNSVDAIAERQAADHLFPGKIVIEMEEKDGSCILRISDNGTGIPTPVQNRIFNPLFTTRDPGLFSGMGLTTAFTIVSEHHGSLEILSQTGSGTTAIIALPISRKSNF